MLICQICKSQDVRLQGQLGQQAQIRCSDCHSWFSINADQLEEEPEEDIDD